MSKWLDRVAALQQMSSSGGQLSSWDNYLLSYYNRIQPYQGTRYYDLLVNNPYLNREFGGTTIGNILGDSNGDSMWSYGNNFLSTFLNALTFGASGAIGNSLNDTAASQFYQSQASSADEEFARILSMKEQDEYNSPASQMARQKAAGINTSLASAENIPASSGAGPDETASPLGGAEIAAAQEGQLQQIAGFASSFVGGCLNLYQFFQDAKGRSIGNSASDIQLADTVYNYAVKTAAGLSGLPGTRAEYDALTEDEKLGADQTVFETLQAALKTGDLGSMQLDRRARSMLKRMTGRVMYDKDGKPTLAFQAQRAAMLKQFYGDTLDAGKSAGHPVMSTPEDFVSVIEKSMTFFGDFESKVREAQMKLQDINVRYQSAQAVSAEAQSSYDKGMYSEELGSTEADARQAEAAQRKITAELDSYLDKQLDTLMDSLDDYGIGGKIAKIGLISLRTALKSFTASLNPLHNKAGQFTGFAPGFGIK